MKIILLSDDSIRLEGLPGPMTIEAPSAETTYSPFHMLGSSLATCTYSVLASWGSTVGIDHEGLAIDVTWAFAEKPHRVGTVTLTFEWPALPAARIETAKRVAALCPIHATLHRAATVVIDAKNPAATDARTPVGAATGGSR